MFNQSNIAADIDDAETKELVQKISGLHNINTPLYNNHNDISKIQTLYPIKFFR